jgi:hypothetical protein
MFVPAQPERHVFRDRHRIEQRRALKHHAEFPAHAQQLAFVHRHDVLAVNQHLARVRLQQADEVLEQNAFAAAAAPDDDDRFAVFNPKADAVEDFVRAETFFQMRTSIIIAPRVCPAPASGKSS